MENDTRPTANLHKKTAFKLGYNDHGLATANL